MRTYFYELMTDVRGGFWDKLVQALLWVSSKVYSFVVTFTRALYQDRLLPVFRSPKPVISIGNITIGGVGKTPLVIWLAGVLKQKGFKIAVLSRGYGSSCQTSLVGSDSSKGFNDEALMFKEILPNVSIAVGSDRKKSIQRVLAKEEVDIFIADDAFSHWPLHRDLDVVAIDASNPFGNGHLIPRGILRERLENLVRADVFVLTKIDKAKSTRLLCDELRRINSRALIAQSRHVPLHFRDVFTDQIRSLADLNKQQVVSFCAIGDPSSFKFTLQETGIDLVETFTFSDHHLYVEEDIRKILAFAVKENINILVTTHKDAVKITPFKKLLGGFKVLSLEIQLEMIQGQDEIIKRIHSLRHN